MQRLIGRTFDCVRHGELLPGFTLNIPSWAEAVRKMLTASESGCHIATCHHTHFGSLTRLEPEFVVKWKNSQGVSVVQQTGELSAEVAENSRLGQVNGVLADPEFG